MFVIKYCNSRNEPLPLHWQAFSQCKQMIVITSTFSSQMQNHLHYPFDIIYEIYRIYLLYSSTYLSTNTHTCEWSVKCCNRNKVSSNFLAFYICKLPFGFMPIRVFDARECEWKWSTLIFPSFHFFFSIFFLFTCTFNISSKSENIYIYK